MWYDYISILIYMWQSILNYFFTLSPVDTMKKVLFTEYSANLHYAFSLYFYFEYLTTSKTVLILYYKYSCHM
jgi:hypothetical protein